MKVHIESRMVVYYDNPETEPHAMAMASEPFDLPDQPKLNDIAGVLEVVQHNAQQLYQAFVADSHKLPPMVAGHQTQEVTRQGLMGLISAMDASKVRLIESISTNRGEDGITWWCLKLGPVN